MRGAIAPSALIGAAITTMRGRMDSLRGIKRQLDQTAAALNEGGSGAVGMLECRLADLQNRMLSEPATTLDDLVVRLEALCELIEGLGADGYLRHLARAALADARQLNEASKRGMT